MHQADAEQHQRAAAIDPQAVLPASQQALELQREAGAEQERKDRVELAVHEQVVQAVLPQVAGGAAPGHALRVGDHAPAGPVQDVGEQDAEQGEAAQGIDDVEALVAGDGCSLMACHAVFPCDAPV